MANLTECLLTTLLVLSRLCVQCRAFGTGEKMKTCKEECSYFNLITVKDRNKLPQPNDYPYPVMHCKERDANDCWFYYTYAVNDTEREVHVVDKLGKERAGLTGNRVWKVSVTEKANYRGHGGWLTKIELLFTHI